MTRAARLGCALLLVCPVRALAQGGAECATAECAPSGQGLEARPSASAFRELWLEATQAHELKLRFVAAIRQFTEAQAGTFGDEGPALAAAVRAMRTSLAAWDDAIRRIESAAGPAQAAEPRLVLGAIYLDRQRALDALRELGAAVRLDESRADVLASVALAHTLAGRPADAARALRQAAALDATNPALQYVLAQRARDIDRPEEALQALRRFTRLRARPDARAARPVAPFDRVELIRQPAGVAPVFASPRYAAGFARLEAGDYAGAVAQFAEAIAGDPLSASAAGSERVRQAASLLRDGQVRAALDQIEPEVRDAAGSSEAHRVAGLAIWVAGDHNRSIERLRTAIRLRPDDERARLNLAFVLRAADRPSEAERELRDALAVIPSSAHASYQLGRLLEAQSLLPQAVRAFDESAAPGPVVGRDHLYQKIGSLSVNQADFDGAVAAYRKRIAVNPNSADAHRGLGEIYYLQGRDDEALAEFMAATWLDPGDARAHAAAGQVHLRAQRFGEAADALARAVALDGTRRDARYALGQALLRLGRTDEGRRELAEFQRLQSGDEARGQRDFRTEQARREASGRLVAGDVAGAIGLLQEIAAADPGDPRSLRDLGYALLRARMVAEATACFEGAQRLEPTVAGHRALADAYAAAGRAADSRQHNGLADAAALLERLAQLRDPALRP